ncbi:methyltransferase domain-containing protein [Clostridium tagluense]|uniref:pseudaminic acid biosynthesis-associated methylase n=1 Tax=Clostridium tagluense TaxID=360422 RepID=UPI001CF29B9F|nr:pseudaminic acid biosynthesis-associated methylase [Clostridium tagluense]MCB2310032.1 methyltransferase domain-containing protein [Clostridium tagluense]MCB2314438.1 methyltransferase domain-containing protein [Clostridium tagluense]MCB2319284.1 methyltransferase domain-containing protein [Clostridium tagluense]MCB2324626.1 methyltransferase domain-containing protein [Clostridium tagluense]MCB2329477.1 methyltransferase domain-containing protein [Clostridium tagluense]
MLKLEHNNQESLWSGDFGKAYTERNIYSPIELDKFYEDTYGVSRTDMNLLFLDKMDKDSCRILEIGSNVGNQLRLLQKMGFKNLYGIELQSYAVKRAKELTSDINIIQASAEDIPFKDGFFDLVFTSGVLIHIAPENLPNIMKEIVRCSKKYIWGFEYYAEVFTEIQYRGNNNALWKGDYSEEYIKYNPKLKFVKQNQYKYLNDANIDFMYLLSK